MHEYNLIYVEWFSSTCLIRRITYTLGRDPIPIPYPYTLSLYPIPITHTLSLYHIPIPYSYTLSLCPIPVLYPYTLNPIPYPQNTIPIPHPHTLYTLNPIPYPSTLYMCLTKEGGRSKGTCLVENKQGEVQNNKNTMQNKENKLLENMHTEKHRNFQLDPPSFRHNHTHCLCFNTAKGAVAMLLRRSFRNS